MSTSTLPTTARTALTLRQTAQRYDWKEQTLRQWRHEGRGPKSYVVAGRVYYDIEDIEAWIAVEKLKSARGGIA